MARKKPRQQVGEVRVTEGEEPRKPRRVTRLDFSIDYEPPTPDRVSLITTSEPERREGGGHLYDQAARWANDNPLIDSDRQAAFAALGMKLAMLTQFLLDTQVTPSEDGLYHLEVEIDPEDPTHYTVNFQYPVGTAAILGANATALAPGANPTASIDQNGILQLGIPAGSPGEDGAPGADGEDGQSVTSVTASTLSPGSSATADYDPQTGELLLGIPQGAQGVQGPPGQSTLITLPESTGEDDQDSCNVAGFLAEEVIQKVLTSIITSRQEAKNRNAQVADAVEALIGVRFGRNIPGFGAIVGLVGDGVRQFVDAVANSDLSSLIAARDDSSLWSDVACAVYCAITPNRGISAGNMQAVLDAVGGVVYTPNQGIITEFVNFMEALQLEGLQAISYSGIYAVYNCSGCECEETLTPMIITFDEGGYAHTLPSSAGLGQIQSSGGDNNSQWYKSTVSSSPNDCSIPTTLWIDFDLAESVDRISASVWSAWGNVTWGVKDTQGNWIQYDFLSSLSGWTSRTLNLSTALSPGSYRIEITNCWGSGLYVGLDSIHLWRVGEA